MCLFNLVICMTTTFFVNSMLIMVPMYSCIPVKHLNMVQFQNIMENNTLNTTPEFWDLDFELVIMLLGVILILTLCLGAIL